MVYARSRGRLKKLLGRFALTIVLGAATRVGVAWWGVVKSPGPVVIGRGSSPNGGDLAIFVSRSSPMRASRLCLILGNTDRITFSTDSSHPDELVHAGSRWGRFTLGAVPRLSATQAAQVDGGGAVLVREDAAGWPMLALWAAGGSADAAYADKRTTPLLEVTRKNIDGKVLPYRPIWPGFAVNSVVFAGVWAVLLVSASLLSRTVDSARRRARQRQGRCEGCGFELRDSAGDVCPECGRERRAAGNRNQATGKLSPREHTEGTEKSTED